MNRTLPRSSAAHGTFANRERNAVTQGQLERIVKAGFCAMPFT
jgi:hypothetical protein